MKKKIIVLGAGLVGKTIATDLSTEYDVTSADASEDVLNSIIHPTIKKLKADFNDHHALRQLVAPFDLVVGAVPGFMGFETLRSVITARKNVVDISFFPEDPFELDQLAKVNKVVAVVDCGVAPGMGNIILGYHNKRMTVTSYECYVGGLPSSPEWPYKYRAVFSPVDVIEEYTRPARYIKNGKLVVKEALSEPEPITLRGAGTLEAWNSDGLRTLITTMPHIPDMIEKTLRYPGSIELLRALRESGFFSKEEILVGDSRVRPLDVTAKLLFPLWKLKPGEEEFTAMLIRIKGEKDGKNEGWEYHLFDKTDHHSGTLNVAQSPFGDSAGTSEDSAGTETDKQSGTLSMARTTGFTCTGAARLVVEGKYTRTGISPPEFLGEEEENFNFIMEHLAARGVRYVTERL